MSVPTKHFLDDEKYDWKKPESTELYLIMLGAYGSPPRAEMILMRSGVDRDAVNFAQPARDFWMRALEAAATAGCTRRLVEIARGEANIAAYHPRLEKLLGGSPGAAEAPLQEKPAEAWKGYEVITGGQPTFLEMVFLHEGLRVAASVVRLRTMTKKGKAFSGTGFLIAENTILTNHHVLFDGPTAEASRVAQVNIWFNYELDAENRPRAVDEYEGDVSTIDGDPTHDWAIIRPTKPFKSGYPTLSLRPTKPVEKGDYVYIIQHPGGESKKIGLLHNEVVEVTPERVQYLTDTLGGSSGSPVFNNRWQVVALHHFGFEKNPATGSACKNQGIHIARVVDGLIARKILPEEAR